MWTTSTTRVVARMLAMVASVASIAIAASATLAAAHVGIAAAESTTSGMKPSATHAGPNEPSNRGLQGLEAKHRRSSVDVVRPTG